MYGRWQLPFPWTWKSPTVSRLRTILRSNREIALMRRAGLVVWEALELAAKMIRPGITTGQIDAAIEQFFHQRNAVPLFKGVPGPVPFPAVCCTSINEEVVHGIPGPRLLREGDILSLDTGCKLDGWCGDAAATYPVGQIAPDVQRLLEVTKATLDLAISLMANKKFWSQVAAEMAEFVRSHGFSVVEAFVGHGIGREMHEEPQVPNFVSPTWLRSGDFPIRPGLVIAIEPMVNMGTKRVRLQPDHWTQVTADGKPSAHFEHTVAMTEWGPYILTGPPGQPLDEVFLSPKMDGKG
jgi:methionyl aminopeptidase